jgi:hypothetical protein
MSRKSSRLSPSPSSPPPPAPPQQQYLNYVPLSRSNSNVSNYNPLTRENNREDQYSTVSSESSKIGRFELTSDLRHSVVDSSKVTLLCLVVSIIITRIFVRLYYTTSTGGFLFWFNL